MSIEELAFQQNVRSSLSQLDGQLIPVLESLISHQYPAQVAALDFEIFSDQFTEGFPVRAFFLDNTNTECFVYVDGRATYPSPVDPGLLEIDCVYPVSHEEQLEMASSDSDLWQIATSELLDWFLACWMKAGGQNFALAATIAEHDSRSELNLMTGETQRRGSTFAR
ncbi:hypothetical protein [Stenotrophomonas sp.]|uniref:hypothetical protein n=1 Tax=Stenotrophomonas sp. TaxID=69392 RepID=UPI0028991661|nr:hypothetical protein [Stenotrophomonas sp.]